MGALLTKKQNAFNDNCNNLAIILFRLASENDNQDNIVFSPISIALILGMLYQGAEGTTKMAMKSLLQKKKIGHETLRNSYRDLISTLTNENADFKLNIANKIFVNNNMRLSDKFTNTLKTFFLSEAEVVDFSEQESAAKLINGWIEANTCGKIHDLIGSHELEADWMLLLVNAIYFKAEWKTTFTNENAGHTASNIFHLLNGTQENCDFMNMTNYFHYTENNDVRVLILPYKNDLLHMIVFLPKLRGKENFLAFEQSLTTERVNVLIDKCKETIVVVSLPKFKAEAEFPLKKVLTEVGLGIIFTPQADFNSTGADLHVNDAKHKAFINVNELGTEAAAATYIELHGCGLGPRPEFIADHPFVYVIRHTPTHCLLFLGRLVDPCQ